MPQEGSLLAALLANRHQNLQRWSREEDKAPESASPFWLLAAQHVGSKHAWLGLEVQRAVVKAGVSLLLAVL